AYAPPQQDLPPPPPPPTGQLAPGVLARGARVAGWVLLLNAVLGVVERAATDIAQQGSTFALIIDFAIGLSLVRGRPRYLKWAIARAVLGALVFCTLAAVRSDYVMAGFQAAFSGALLALLIGNAGAARIIVAGSIVVLCLVAEGVGLVLTMTHRM